MSSVAFDNSFLSILLNPNSKPVYHLGTTNVVEVALERANSVVSQLENARRKIILPAPALAELLTAIGPEAQQYVNIVSRSRVFEVGNFDARAATELAILNRGVFSQSDEENRLDTYQKRKVDRQIIAVCKVYGVSELYTDDRGMAKLAKLCGIAPIALSEVPIPATALQRSLGLAPHESLPEVEDDD